MLVVSGLGDTERAAMYLELEKVTKELKEQEWRLGRVKRVYSLVNSYLKENMVSRALEAIDGLDAEDAKYLNLEEIKGFLANFAELQGKKADLEKKLGMKVSLE